MCCISILTILGDANRVAGLCSGWRVGIGCGCLVVYFMIESNNQTLTPGMVDGSMIVADANQTPENTNQPLVVNIQPYRLLSVAILVPVRGFQLE